MVAQKTAAVYQFDQNTNTDIQVLKLMTSPHFIEGGNGYICTAKRVERLSFVENILGTTRLNYTVTTEEVECFFSVRIAPISEVIEDSYTRLALATKFNDRWHCLALLLRIPK
mgnify:CR=1 FL=1